LASIPPFGEQQSWQARPTSLEQIQAIRLKWLTQSRLNEKRWKVLSGICAQRFCAAKQYSQRRNIQQSEPVIAWVGHGNATASRLESAASTAVRTPVLAVIEYNYERDGEIIVPAGARVTGHMQDADVLVTSIQFDSLMMPDGATVPIQLLPWTWKCVLKASRRKKHGQERVGPVAKRGSDRLGRRWSDGQPQPAVERIRFLRERVSNNIGRPGMSRYRGLQ